MKEKLPVTIESQPVALGAPAMTKDEEASFNKAMDAAMVAMRDGDNGDKPTYDRALGEYREAVRISHQGNWLPYYNLGEVYRRLGRFSEAEDMYNKVLQISGDTELRAYLSKIEMYRYQLKKSDAEIRAVYEKALNSSDDQANARVSYASYLRDSGDKNGAIEQFKILLKRFPGNQTYQAEIDSLSGK